MAVALLPCLRLPVARAEAEPVKLGVPVPVPVPKAKRGPLPAAAGSPPMLAEAAALAVKLADAEVVKVELKMVVRVGKREKEMVWHMLTVLLRLEEAEVVEDCEGERVLHCEGEGEGLPLAEAVAHTVAVEERE